MAYSRMKVTSKVTRYSLILPFSTLPFSDFTSKPDWPGGPMSAYQHNSGFYGAEQVTPAQCQKLPRAVAQNPPSIDRLHRDQGPGGFDDDRPNPHSNKRVLSDNENRAFRPPAKCRIGGHLPQKMDRFPLLAATRA
jgi:hypothetical protein